MAPPTGTLPAPPPTGHADDPATDHAPDGVRGVLGGASVRHPARPSRPPWPPSVAVTLGALLAALLVLVVAAVTGPGADRRAADDRDAQTPAVQHAVLAHRMQGELELQRQEWRTVALQGWNTGAQSGHVTEFRNRAAAVDALAAQLQDQVPDRGTVDGLIAFRNDHGAAVQAQENALAAFVAAGSRDPAVLQRATDGPGPATRLAGVVDRLDAAAAASRADRQAALARERVVLLALGLLIVAVMAAVVAVVVVRVVRPLRRLAHQADRAARHDLPAALARIAAQPDAGARPARLPDPGAGGEWAVLGRALAVVQDTAVSLAVRQRHAEREAAQTLVDLARRHQNLVESAQACLDGLADGGGERDPAVVDGLARLARTTGRIRRSADSMLVLGGAAPPRRAGARPVPVSGIVDAATREIADGARVDVRHVEEAAIVGTAAADLTHLLAELLDNATQFSPPDARVTVVGRFGSSGRYELHVIDQGIGMADPDLAGANARLAGAVAGGRRDAHRLGLRVVGRLAARLAARVTLHPSARRGVTALVDLPGSAVVDVERAAERDTGTPAYGAARATPPRGTPPPSS